MASGDNAVTCGNSTQTFLELLGRTMGVDANGKVYLRQLSTTNVPGSKAFGCGKPVGDEEIENGMRGLFAFDANGDLAIRIASTT